MSSRRRAMYAYTASPDDPNEVSFAKGDILDVVDNTGKWFQVRTPSGQTGVSADTMPSADARLLHQTTSQCCSEMHADYDFFFFFFFFLLPPAVGFFAVS